MTTRSGEDDIDVHDHDHDDEDDEYGGFENDDDVYDEYDEEDELEVRSVFSLFFEYTCQYCGREIPITDDEARHWHIDRHRRAPDVILVRCPNHIYRWVLKWSHSGRSIAALRKALRGRRMVLDPKYNYIEEPEAD